MKPTSLFLAIGLAVCQLVAAAPKSTTPADVHVKWWTAPNYEGESGEDGVNPGSCENLDPKWVDQIQSVRVDDGGSCDLFNAEDCFGPSIHLVGANPTLPPAFSGNTSSYSCQF